MVELFQCFYVSFRNCSLRDVVRGNGDDTLYESFAKVSIIETVIFSDKFSHTVIGMSSSKFESETERF